MKLILLEVATIVELKYRVSELTIHDAEFIYDNSNYKDFISIEYIIERITAQAKEALLEEEAVREVLSSSKYTDRVREDETEAQVIATD